MADSSEQARSGGEPREERRSLGTKRIESLADGVFSIAMTLLVLEIKLPKPDPANGLTIFGTALSIWPKFATYGLSFMVGGVFWISHQSLMHFVERTDRTFLWLNVVFLWLVSAIPFSAALLGDYHPDPDAIAIYGLHLMTCGLLMHAQITYALEHGRLTRKTIEPELILAAKTRTRMAIGLYALAIMVSRWSPNAAMGVCAFTLVFHVMPGRIDRFLKG